MLKFPFRGRDTEELDPRRLETLSVFRLRSQPLLQPRVRQQRLPHTKSRYSAFTVKAMVISFTLFAIAVVLFGLWLHH
jgi:hypothetical protein